MSFTGTRMKTLFFIPALVLFLNAESMSEVYSKESIPCEKHEGVLNACKDGDGKSCFLSSLVFVRGICVEKDSEYAYDLLKKSCDLEYAKGCQAVGYISFMQNDMNAAARYNKKACDLDMKFCVDYGQLLFYGKGVEKDELVAKEYFKKSCDVGNPVGCGDFAMALQKNDAPLEEIIKFYKLGCDGGYYESCNHLGRMQIANKQKKEAVESFKKACDNGDIRDACSDVAVFTDDENEQLEYMKKDKNLACKDGDEKACKDIQVIEKIK